MNTLKYISLFSGMGGLDEGLHGAGFTPLLCCELDVHARRTLENWTKLRGVSPQIEQDVNDIDLSKMLTQLDLLPGELDLLAGGPPCQSFSLAGKRGSLQDERGLLLFQMIKFAAALRPKAILVEQVKGLLSAPGHDGERGGAFKSFVGELEELGYSVSYKVLKASDYGVPQNRERLFIVASEKKEFRFPMPTHKQSAKDSEDLFSSNLSPYLTVRDAISDLPPPVVKGSEPSFPNHLDITPSRDKERITGVPEGDFLARQLHLPKHQRMRLNPKKDTTKFRRLAWDSPSLTLRCGEAFYHPQSDRYLTPREYMRLHGFPDELVLEGPIRGRSGSVKDLDQHRQVANAVPPPLARALGIDIVEQLLSSRAPFTHSRLRA